MYLDFLLSLSSAFLFDFFHSSQLTDPTHILLDLCPSIFGLGVVDGFGFKFLFPVFHCWYIEIFLSVALVFVTLPNPYISSKTYFVNSLGLST